MKKWFYEMTRDERKVTKPSDIIIGFDRLDNRPITLDSLYAVWIEKRSDLNRKEQRYK